MDHYRGEIFLKPIPELLFSSSYLRSKESVQWKPEVKSKPKIYALIVGPYFNFLRLIGRAPFYRDNDGSMKFKLWSGITLYTVAIYVLISANAIFSIKDIYNNIQPSFDDEIDTLLTSATIVPQLVTPILSWLLIPRQEAYLKEWARFQDDYEVVTGREFPKVSELTPAKSNLFIHFSFTIFVVTVILPYYLKDDLRWKHGPSFYFSVFGSLLHFWIWMMTANAISVVSKTFHRLFRKEVLKQKGYTRHMEQYRLLWIQLTRLIRGCGSSSSYIVSAFVLLNIFCLVIVTYDVAFALSEYANSGEFIAFLVGVLLSYIWWKFMYAYCDAGFRMMECAKRGVLENAMLMKRNGIFEEELRMNLFLFTLRTFQPMATVSDYYIVNRQLFGSIASSLFTYILVVKQFNLSNVSVLDSHPQVNESY